MSKHFCAICTNDIVGPVRRERLGKNDAFVVVCDACAKETPRVAGSYSPRADRFTPTRAESAAIRWKNGKAVQR